MKNRINVHSLESGKRHPIQLVSIILSFSIQLKKGDMIESFTRIKIR